MNKDKKSISVCLATFNGELYIKDQIASILPQLASSDEIVISDNGSSDETLKIIDSFGDKRIRVFHCNKPGVVNNFENSIKRANNEIIFLCDQDDVWLSGRVDMALGEHDNADLVSVGYRVVDKNLNEMNTSIRLPNTSFLSTIYKNGYIGCGLSFHRKVLKDVLPFPNTIAMHDWWVALICTAKYRVCNLDTIGFLYRRHGDNVSSTSGESQLSLSKKLNIRIHIFYHVILRLLKFN